MLSGQRVHYLTLKRTEDNGKWTQELRIRGVIISRKNKNLNILQVLEEISCEAAVCLFS